ncbi:MAG: FAD-dependent oxidoreductase [Candidatus Eisenbacteria bacterium]
MASEKTPHPALPGLPADAIPVTLERRDPVAEGTYEFLFGLGTTVVPYFPGQAVDLHFPTATRPDPRGHARPFSLASAPGSSRLTIATRIRDSPFKQELLEAPLGTGLFVSPPWGDFVVPADEKDVVLLAGGIGVTPFRAMIQDAVARSSPTEMSLLHAARTPEEAPFYDEFRRWALTHGHLTYAPVMSRAETSSIPYLGERGRLDAAVLDEMLDDARGQALYMIAGPPHFVSAMVAALGQVGVPAGRIKSNEFPGY